jgi:hypothetical protein
MMRSGVVPVSACCLAPGKVSFGVGLSSDQDSGHASDNPGLRTVTREMTDPNGVHTGVQKYCIPGAAVKSCFFLLTEEIFFVTYSGKAPLLVFCPDVRRSEKADGKGRRYK